MKKIIFLFTALLFIPKTKAQYFALQLDSSRFYFTALSYPTDGNYRVLVDEVEYRPPYKKPKYHPTIKIYDSNHQYLNTIHLPRGLFLKENPPLKEGNRLLWPCIYWDSTTINSPTPMFYTACVLELDTLYNPVTLHKIGVLQEKPGEPMGIVSFQNGFVTVGAVNNTTLSANNNILRVYKTNKNFSKSDSADILLLPSFNDASVETNVGYNNQIILSGYDFSNNYSSLFACQLTTPYAQGFILRKFVMDTTLNVIDCKAMNNIDTSYCYDPSIHATVSLYDFLDGIDGAAAAISSTKSFAFGGTAALWPCFNEGAVDVIFDNNNNIVKKHLYRDSSNIRVTYFRNVQPHACYAIKSPYILTLAQIGYGVSYGGYMPYVAPLFPVHLTKMLVTKMDTMGNIIWRKIYGGEMTYFGHSIAFTKDGGCVIAGIRYDSLSMSGLITPHNYMYGTWQNFLLKLDVNGDTLGADVGIEEVKSQKSKVKIYPNPANTEVYFDMPNEREFDVEIYNTLGQLVLNKNNYTNRSALNINTLSKNLYFYKINTRQYIYTGKFVKE